MGFQSLFNEVNVLSYLFRRTRGLMTAAALASILSGLFSVLLIAQINAALTGDAASRADSHVNPAWVFAGIAVALMLCRMVSTALFERLGQRALAELRSFVAQCVAETPLLGSSVWAVRGSSRHSPSTATTWRYCLLACR